MNTGFLGIVMLDTRFPLLPGDIGNTDSLPMPARRVVVAGAWPEKVVQSAKGLRAAQLLKPFVSVVRQLERDGAAAITTSCSFLVLLQRELQAAVHVPVVTSSLLLLPALLREQRHVGVLTISAKRLGEEHLRSAGVPRERLADVLVQGVDLGGEFAGAILGNRAELDADRASREVVAAAQALKTRAPDLSTVVLECTNMPPYREAIEQATGLRALSVLDAPMLRRAFSS
ncbi:MAG: aspartate/glutamate racemase family protein [Burkholderiaceae bacterium]|nr:aspartate/glutamate racemase family protein [Burkholderiaceae bacterium]